MAFINSVRGWLTGVTVGTADIVADAVTQAKIADNAVGTAQIVEKNNPTLLRATGRDGDHVPGKAFGGPTLAVPLLLVASAIMSNAK